MSLRDVYLAIMIGILERCTTKGFRASYIGTVLIYTPKNQLLGIQTKNNKTPIGCIFRLGTENL